MKTKAVSEAVEYMSLNKALRYCGVSKCAWHYTKKFKVIPIDASVTHKVRQIVSRRPTYGTRRMAAQISRETGVSTNRKKIQRIYRKIGWNEPQKTKNDIIRISRRKRFKPTGPNQLWETDITYIHCGRDGWCYCFNVLDVFTRKWAAYMFDTAATADTAIQSVLQAVSEAGGKVPGLRLRTDNGSQYISRKFREAMKALGIRHEFIWKHTPEQNGHVESFHGTLKREYVWPHEFVRFQDAEVVLARAFADYNNDRIHSALGYVTPNEFARKVEDGNK